MNLIQASVIRAALGSLLLLAGCHSGNSLDSMYSVAPLTYDTGNMPLPTTSQQATLSPKPVIDPKTGIPVPIDLENFHFLGDANIAVVNASLDSSGLTRNRLKATLVERSNLICQYTEAQIVGTDDWINFGLGETTTILGAAGAIVTTAIPARVLSGLAGG